MEERHPLNDTCNILLGVTGSVAAVKIPELISHLLDKFGSKIAIKVVLTEGGKNFWEKASTYDAMHWNKIQQFLERSSTHRQINEATTASKIQVYCKWCLHLNIVYVKRTHSLI
jgi:phosphopantothenoylcysteine synthetase/decarboxylase